MNYQQIQDWKLVKTIDDAKQWHLKHTPYFDIKVIDELVNNYPKLIKKENLKQALKQTEEITEFIKYLWQ